MGFLSRQPGELSWDDRLARFLRAESAGMKSRQSCVPASSHLRTGQKPEAILIWVQSGTLRNLLEGRSAKRSCSGSPERPDNSLLRMDRVQSGLHGQPTLRTWWSPRPCWQEFQRMTIDDRSNDGACRHKPPWANSCNSRQSHQYRRCLPS
jgi:hypothetical protein